MGMNYYTKIKTETTHILPLEGATYFREPGGYPAANGRRVRYEEYGVSNSQLNALRDAYLD